MQIESRGTIGGSNVWTGKRFEGDENKLLQQVQHDTYAGSSNHIGKLFGICSNRFLESARLLEAKSDLFEALRNATTFDHRTLQEAHDIIAAYYRYAVDKGLSELNFEGSDTDKVMLENWVEWYRAELKALVQFDSFTRNVCIAAAFPNPDERGKEAEEVLAIFLDEHYRCNDGSPFAVSGLTKR